MGWGEGGSLLLEGVNGEPAVLRLYTPGAPPRLVAQGLPWPAGPREQWAQQLPIPAALRGTRARPGTGAPPAWGGLQLRQQGSEVWLEPPAEARQQPGERVLTLPRRPQRLWWIETHDGHLVGVEVTYRGHPQVRTVRPLPLAAAAARLWFRLAYEAHQRGDYRAAFRDWTRSWEADPDPGRADVLYNLACAASRLGDPQEALEFLGRALAADAQRFVPLAQEDDDLAPLRSREEFWSLLRLHPGGGGGPGR